MKPHLIKQNIYNTYSFATYRGPTQFKGVVSIVAHRGY